MWPKFVVGEEGTQRELGSSPQGGGRMHRLTAIPMTASMIPEDTGEDIVAGTVEQPTRTPRTYKPG